MRLPEARMEVAGLAVSRPAAVGIGKRKVDLVEQPSGYMMRRSQQHAESVAGLATLQIMERRTRGRVRRHRLRRRAFLQQWLHPRARIVQCSEAVLLRR